MMTRIYVKTWGKQNKYTPLDEALKRINKCRASHTKTLNIVNIGHINVFPEEIRQLT